MLVALFFLMVGTSVLIAAGPVFGTVPVRFLLFEALSALSAGAVVLAQVRSSFRSFLTPVMGAVFLWFVVLAGTLLVSDDRSVAFFGFLHRQNGLLDLFFLLPFFLLARMLLVQKDLSRALVRFLVVLGILEGAFSLWQVIPAQSGIAALFGGRAVGSFGNPDFLALALLVFFFFAVLLAVDADESPYWRLTALVSLLLVAFALLAANFRGAFLGLLLGTGVFLYFVRRVFFVPKKKLFVLAAVLACVLGVVLGMALLVASNDQFLPHLFSFETIEQRLIVWQTALEVFTHRPFFGWGHASFLSTFDLFYPQELSRDELLGLGWYDAPHNIFLEQAVEGGVLGLVSFLLLFAVPFLVLLKLRKRPDVSRPMIAAFLALLVSLAVALSTIFHERGTWVLFFLVLAFVDALWLRAQGQQKSAVQSFSRFGAIGFVSGVMLLALMTSLIWQSTLRASTFMGLAEARTTYKEKAYLSLKAVESSGFISASIALANANSMYEEILKASPQEWHQQDIRAFGIELEHGARKELNRTENARTWFILGRALLMRGGGENDNAARLMEAEYAFQQARALSPQRETILWGLAETKEARKRWDESEALYRSVTERNPALAEGHARFGLFFLARFVEEGTIPEHLRSQALEHFIQARESGFHFNRFFGSLWFADPFALSGEWQKSAVFWEEARTLCERIVEEVEQDGECAQFSSHFQVAQEKSQAVFSPETDAKRHPE